MFIYIHSNTKVQFPPLTTDSERSDAVDGAHRQISPPPSLTSVQTLLTTEKKILLTSLASDSTKTKANITSDSHTLLLVSFMTIQKLYLYCCNL